ncbi:hypothetical protein [Sphingopyxis panaciterrae]
MAVERKPLAHGEADRLADDPLFGEFAAARAAGRSLSRLHDDREFPRIENARGCRFIFGLLEGDHVGVEAFGDPPHGRIIAVGARVAAGAIPLGEEFEVPTGELDRSRRRVRRAGRARHASAGGDRKDERRGGETVKEHRPSVAHGPREFNVFAADRADPMASRGAGRYSASPAGMGPANKKGNSI